VLAYYKCQQVNVVEPKNCRLFEREGKQINVMCGENAEYLTLKCYVHVINTGLYAVSKTM